MLQDVILYGAAWRDHFPALLFSVVAVCLCFWFLRRGVSSRWSGQRPAEGGGQNGTASQRMRLIARDHQVRGKSGRRLLAGIIRQNFRELRQVRQDLSTAPAEAIRRVPAARLLIDNYPQIHRHLKQLQEEAGSHHAVQLPALAAGGYRGYPRAYLLAGEMTAALANVVDRESVVALLAAYQEICPLTAAELWAMPDLLSLSLVERTVAAAREITAALRAAAEDPMTQSGRMQAPPGVGEGQGLETQFSVLVTSLQAAAELDWEDDFEKVSLMEEALRQDPAGIYPLMDGETKNRYRWAVEKLSARSSLAEERVAQWAVQLAGQAAAAADGPLFRHIGFYLIGHGRRQLAASLYGRTLDRDRLRAAAEKSRGFLYFGGIFLVTVLVLGGMGRAISPLLPADYRTFWLFLAAAVFPAMEIGVSLINQLFTRFIHPQPLPAMDFLQGIPDSCRTFVVMPVILGSVGQAERYVSRLEKYYLANRQQNLCFAILGDYKDAPARVMAEDRQIQDAALAAVRELNSRYPAEQTRFSLLIRSRQWNPAENCWMGWERKRGKLEEFNMLICGSQETSYSLISTDPAVFGSFKYAITLDADTELIRDSAARLVGIMEHPLNRPVFDQEEHRIVDGYVIVQSEIRSRITSAQSSLFARYFSGQTGIDSYTSVVSDVYQDTFNEGIFVGKGIYNIQAMHQLLHGTIPENSVLSHDLLESCLTRCAFASGIKLMDASPASVAAYAKREHRWIRGDWQLLPWLFRPSPLSGLSRWKLFENLRRSLMHIVYLLLMLLNFFLLPEKAWLWLPVVFFSPLLQLVLIVFDLLRQKMSHPTARIVWRSLRGRLSALWLQTLFGFIFMPYRAYVALDAVGRTLYRLLISRRRMLEWQTAEAVENKIRNTLSGYLQLMWLSWLPAALLLWFVFPPQPVSLRLGAGLIALLWLGAPLIAAFSSRPLPEQGKGRLRQAEQQELRSLARCTYRYFEDFSLAENHYLCPDNCQLPAGKLARRTSPTNIGLQLLSLLSARDLGYIGLLSWLEKCEALLDTVSALPKWHGHLYNWYNIETLEVLMPDYVSTVDSGNFIGCLIALKNGLLEMKEQPVFNESCRQGLLDTLSAARFQPADALTSGKSLPQWLAEVSLLASRLEADKEDRQNQDWTGQIKILCHQFLADAAAFPAKGYDGSRTPLTGSGFAGGKVTADFCRRIDHLAARIEEIVAAADFRPLYDPGRRLLRIGHHVSARTQDKACYDLLASESRLASFLAVARGDVPQKHWFRLGRPLTLIRGLPTLVSWSGSMFEYLMPDLLMKSYPGTTLHLSGQGAVRQQILYARGQNIPWGISEAQYSVFDEEGSYRYRSMGVPGLMLQSPPLPARVVAPYATLLALQVMPRQAVANIRRLRRLGAEGPYGFYEALDYSGHREGNGAEFSLVLSFMAHHQGMSLVAIDNLLHGKIMVRRFHREALVQAAEILLEETLTVGLVAPASREDAINPI